MSGDVFVDTNILVYAHDRDAGAKHRKARDLVAEAWQSTLPPLLSIQVLQELLVNLRRKGVGPKAARATTEDYMQWRVVENTLTVFAAGLGEMDRWKTSLRDAMILAAARQGGARTIWSEDLSSGQDYGGIEVVNPLE
ncbi:MAG: PIN domain-containing protein [Planctomycetota bacterium]